MFNLPNTAPVYLLHAAGVGVDVDVRVSSKSKGECCTTFVCRNAYASLLLLKYPHLG